ncbi:MAG TPA: HAD-IIA family hydrolase [Bellilinea sp.]|nr:HAD-IIA family hydrolase [Bellilinea sp.]
MPDIRGLILDMDGVIWRADHPIGDLSIIQNLLRQNDFRYVFATNNSTASPLMIQAKLSSLGMDVETQQIINSSIAAAAYVRNKYPDCKSVYIIGESGLEQAVRAVGLEISETDPCAVIVGIDRCINFDKMKLATRLIRAGAEFVGTNGDRTFPTPRGLIPGAGAILAAIQAATDQEPTIVGKPEPTLYQISTQMLGLNQDEVLVVGDRLDTDILGAQRLGMMTALVFSGISTPEEAAKWQHQPTFLAADLTKLLQGDLIDG